MSKTPMRDTLPGLLGVQLLVDAGDHPQEHLLIDSFGQAYCIIPSWTE